MVTKEVNILIDATDVDLEDLAEAFSWRVDPIRKDLFQIDEHINKIKVVNLNKVNLPIDIRNRVTELRVSDYVEVDLLILDIVRAWFTLLTPRGGPTLLDRFAAMLSFVMLFNVMPLFSFDQGHGPDFRFSEYRPHRGFVEGVQDSVSG